MAKPQDDSSRTPTQTDRTLLLLRRMVLTGQFASGKRLTELDLVSRLQASRTPIRYALTRLAHEGLLNALPKGGFRVCKFSIEEVWDAIELRGVLEGTAARLAAERIAHESELSTLRGIQRDIDAIRPVSEANFAHYLERNVAFHHEILLLSKSPMIRRTLDAVLRLPFASPGALVFGETDDARRTAELARLHHLSIIEAIGNREGTRAEHLAREHARIARMNLERALRDPLMFARIPGASLVTLPRAM